MTKNETLDSLVHLSNTLGALDRKLVIIGEGNTSHRADEQSFRVKASGFQLGTIRAEGFVQVYFAPILQLFDNPPGSLAEEREALAAARVDQSTALRPSVETTFHAMLLHDCNVQCIAHTHPIAVNRLLCSSQAELFARNRLFPDEIVLCGPESVFVPYVDPGLPLAKTIRERVRQYMDVYDEAPKVILLKNHGLITLAQTTTEALNITAMCVKAAEILIGTLMIGKPDFLSRDVVMHIYRRPDEIYRRNLFMDDQG